MSKSLLFVTVFFMSVGSWAQGCFDVFKQPQSEPVEAYLSLVSKDSSPELISEAANTVLENYKLNIEDFLLLNNMGAGGNFNNHKGQTRLQELSEQTALTPVQVLSYIKTLDATESAVFFWSLALKKHTEWQKDYYLNGTSADWVSIFLTQYRSLGAKEGQSFANKVFSSPIINSGNLKSLELTADQITQILKALPKNALGTGSLSALLETVGLSTLSQINPELLFSRIYFPNPRAPGFKEDMKHEVALQITVLLGQGRDFLNSLKDSKDIQNIAPEALVEVLIQKNAAIKQLGEVKELKAREYFSQLIPIINSFHMKYTVLETYKLAQDIATHVTNENLFKEVVSYLRQVQLDVVMYEYRINSDVAYDFLLKEYLPLELVAEASPARAFFNRYLEVVKDSYEAIDGAIISKREIMNFIIHSGYELLKMNSQQSLTSQELQLYIHLRIGGVVPGKNAKQWWQFLIPSDGFLPRMNHEEAIAYIQAQKSN